MSDRRLGPFRLLQGASNLRLLVLATFGSGLGTYLAALALTVHVLEAAAATYGLAALLALVLPRGIVLASADGRAEAAPASSI